MPTYSHSIQDLLSVAPQARNDEHEGGWVGAPGKRQSNRVTANLIKGCNDQFSNVQTRTRQPQVQITIEPAEWNAWNWENQDKTTNCDAKESFQNDGQIQNLTNH